MRKAYSLAVLGLSASLFIYLFYRTKNTVVNELIVLLLSPGAYAEIRSSVADVISLNDPFVFSLPGGLWVFCVAILSKGFYLKIGKFTISIVFLPVLFAIGLEIFQLFHITHGTFDPWDIVFYLLFWSMAYYGFRIHGMQQNILSPFSLKGFICLAGFLSVYLAHVSR